MCGIVGYIGHNDFDKTKIQLLLFWNSAERGKDSTGVFTPKSGLIKSIQEAKIFIKDDFERVQDDNMLIGHVRQKSIGQITLTNTHPFLSHNGNIIGCHNGTLTDKDKFANFYGLSGVDYPVDSQLLIELLDKTRSSNSINYYCLEEIEGSAALLFYDVKTKCLNLFSNGDRTLFYGKDGDNGYYISSLKEPLLSINCTDIVECSKNILYSINRNSITLYSTKTIESTAYKSWCKKIEEEKNKQISEAKKKAKKYFNCEPFTIKAIRDLKGLTVVPEISSTLPNSNDYIEENKFYTVVGKMNWKQKDEKFSVLWYLVQTDKMKDYETYCWLRAINFDRDASSMRVQKYNVIKLCKQVTHTYLSQYNHKCTEYYNSGQEFIVTSDNICVEGGNKREFITAKKISGLNNLGQDEIDIYLDSFTCTDVNFIEDMSKYEDSNKVRNLPITKPLVTKNETPDEKNKRLLKSIDSMVNGGMINMTNQISNMYKDLPGWMQTEIGSEFHEFDTALTKFSERVESIKQMYDAYSH